MHCTHLIAADTWYVGASDRRLAKFENLFPSRGACPTTLTSSWTKRPPCWTPPTPACPASSWKTSPIALGGRSLDYLIVDHMEPDHAATIAEVLLRWPEAQIVCNAKTVPMLKAYFPASAGKVDEALLVKEGDVLSLGTHDLTFVMAPMVHWPEVMFTYDKTTQVLFSADAFGTFGALDSNIFADQVDFARDWLDDARRYYANIVGKYGTQVQAVLKKAAGIPIQVIAPLHGPIWRQDLAWFLGKYDLWSRWQPEDNSVVILYGSMYGNTANAAKALAGCLADRGVQGIAVRDLSVTDVSEAVAECFRASTIVLAAPTYNGGIYLPMAHLLEDLKALSLQNRTFALIENGSWAPMSPS